jgi:hypothetical protein
LSILRGLSYTNFVPRGKTVNAVSIIEAPHSLLEGFEGEETGDGGRELVLHWDNAPVHTAAMVAS